MARQKVAARRFPTADDALLIAAEWAPAHMVDAEEIGLRLGRMMADALPGGVGIPFSVPPAAGSVGHADLAVRGAAVRNPAAGTTPTSAPLAMEHLQSLVTRLVRAAQRVRKDHRQLSTAERERFNEVLKQAHGEPDYKDLVAAHKDMSHHHHTMPHMPPSATQRFLPWHRAYCLEMEELLRKTEPMLTIPYWDYANDHARPDWVWQPSGVDRPAPGASHGGHPAPVLPTQATIDGLLARPTYTAFTYGKMMAGVKPDGLEIAAHNNVHNWCGGSLGDPMTAAEDPIFFLLHANVDRIWDQWQLTHTGGPNVTGVDAGLDPWWTQTSGGLTTDGVKDITVLGYSYQ
ncbi:hypothetical protein AQI88_18200 [Streptomyces cellostaticus]|uniref:Tyrosinase copper-binding domain-containing protein n=1 Tax=Streptomyces cellostaticus TaxID=67285 RepID=A0A101NKQ7_9ACTN|nr:tyrosinase family protein [Streptomyces cellostaticus]KUM95143.1 hypothetical protein AQI88_18200 [Streptomyces cellostaticus]GHI02116.1 hypothetical protein Scel_04370 [Streptomyces cellostaticus]